MNKFSKIGNNTLNFRHCAYINVKNVVLSVVFITAVSFLSQGLWIHAKAVLAQWLIQGAWSESQEHPAKPWPWADTWPEARLSVERLGVDLIALRGIEGNSLAFGPGIIPIEREYGETGAKIIAGHNDTHFRFLQNLASNDRVILQNRGEVPTEYQVTSTRIVDSTKENVSLSAGEDLLLITCYPFNSATLRGPMRYVVSARRMLAEVSIGSRPLQKIHVF